MHSGADVEAFQAALNRDIGGDTSTSHSQQPSDSDNGTLFPNFPLGYINFVFCLVWGFISGSLISRILGKEQSFCTQTDTLSI